MQKFIRSLLLVLAGVAIGLFVYSRLNRPASVSQNALDTSFVTAAVAAPPHTDSLAFNRHNAITEAVKKVNPTVISVNVTQINKYIQRSPFTADPFFRQFFPDLFGDRIVKQKVQAIGSGFIISPDGYIVTNEHVVSNATEIVVAMSNGKEYPAKLIGKDHVADIALLKIDKHHLPTAHFGNSDDLLIGEWAIAIGNPFGLFVNNKPTVTVGVISAAKRNFSPLEGRVYEDMIQTDAAINPGNSGGPLCNADGQVIGMNTFIYTGGPNNNGSVGVGFAIPSNHIKKIIERLKKRGSGDKDIWIGMYVSDLNGYLARLLNYPYQSGVYVRRIDRRSPAEKAGIKLGDVVTALNGQKIGSVQDAQNVIEVSDLRVGDKLFVDLWRNGKKLKKTLILTKNPF